MLTQSCDAFINPGPDLIKNKTNPKKRKRLSAEYGRIIKQPKLDCIESMRKYETASIFWNQDRNRYSNILAPESTRVKLVGLKNDYINANHVSIGDPDTQINFISTQAPLPNTVRDFWKMVWDQKSSVIMMLTNYREGGILKANPYWSDKKSTDYRYKAYKFISSGDDSNNDHEYGDDNDDSSDITDINDIYSDNSYNSGDITDNDYIDNDYIDTVLTLQLTKKMKLECGILRIFSLKQGAESRRIFHIKYDSWGDHKEPSSLTDIKILLAYMEVFDLIGSMVDLGGPPIVHCSAGVGRTGTFIACAAVKTLALQKKLIDVPSIVTEMRKCRDGMVQTDDQYAFIYQYREIFS